ncbi:sugar transferase [Caulobacter segnis]|uniref:sugar transferase n=1 Tax=Caulobacter segnis TaxID=88688 RepID=UPI00240F36AF|nr:sugar transferase [Caulobacter segnis]MDG2520296.1 sugar transferase [Caulobacter segnis]
MRPIESAASLSGRVDQLGGGSRLRRTRSWSRNLDPAEEALIRGLDVLIALAALVAIAPLMLIIAGLIKAQDGGPAMFAHGRIGRGGRTFPCLKFRSMVIDAEARLQALLAQDEAARREWEADHKLRNDPRITRLGLFLRKSSLDELPQLLNVLRGEMSIVGPRPIVQGEVSRYGRWYGHYCAVRPGITGLWQVSGRNDVTYRRRVACDVMYARRKSLSVNARIIAGTIPAVLRADGSY